MSSYFSCLRWSLATDASGADGVMVVYSVVTASTLENVNRWIQNLRDKAPDIKDVILVGNQCDREAERVSNFIRLTLFIVMYPLYFHRIHT
jgi:GTPase SAR1 family protein